MTTALSPSLYIWAPGLFDFKGGIQVYSSYFLQALQAQYSQAKLNVFLMHDRLASHSTHPDPASATSPSLTPSIPGSHRSRNATIHPAPTRFHYFGQIPLPFRTAAFAASLLRMGIWQRPDLVITTHLNFTPAAYYLRRLMQIPYWAVAHGFEAWEIQRPAVCQALAHADRILAVSHYTRDRLLENSLFNPERIVVLPNTFDAQRFQIAEKPAYLLQRYGLTADQPVILTVNRLEAKESFHSYDQILAALPQIRQACPRVHYLIAGKGNDRPRLERWIAEHQLQDCVTLAGFVSDAELPDHYNLCDVFAMPSKLEGFGIVYLEALASGKPTVGGYDGAIDALQHGRLGALVNPDDIDAIARTLIQILQKTYPNPLLYQPEVLRQEAIASFGIQQFQLTLAHYLNSMFV